MRWMGTVFLVLALTVPVVTTAQMRGAPMAWAPRAHWVGPLTHAHGGVFIGFNSGPFGPPFVNSPFFGPPVFVGAFGTPFFAPGTFAPPFFGPPVFNGNPFFGTPFVFGRPDRRPHGPPFFRPRRH